MKRYRQVPHYLIEQEKGIMANMLNLRAGLRQQGTLVAREARRNSPRALNTFGVNGGCPVKIMPFAF